MLYLLSYLRTESKSLEPFILGELPHPVNHDNEDVACVPSQRQR